MARWALAEKIVKLILRGVRVVSAVALCVFTYSNILEFCFCFMAYSILSVALKLLTSGDRSFGTLSDAIVSSLVYTYVMMTIAGLYSESYHVIVLFVGLEYGVLWSSIASYNMQPRSVETGRGWCAHLSAPTHVALQMGSDVMVLALLLLPSMYGRTAPVFLVNSWVGEVLQLQRFSTTVLAALCAIPLFVARQMVLLRRLVGQIVVLAEHDASLLAPPASTTSRKTIFHVQHGSPPRRRR